nr:sensory neuron membrane protein 1a [Podabrus annulatus]
MSIRKRAFNPIYVVFPKLLILKQSWSTFRFSFQKYQKMKLPTKILIGSGVTFALIIILGFIALPLLLKSKIKSSLTLKPGGDVRALYTKVPFAIDFKVYIFNITNPNDIVKGDSPVVDEVGPYYFEEWKEKVELVDDEATDELTYKQRITWKFRPDLSAPGLTGEEIVTIPHPMIVAMSIIVARDKPAMLNLVNKALNAIFRNPETPFLTAPVMDILFRGVVINCTVTDFAGKAVCTQLRTEAKDLEHVSDTIFKFSFFGMRNGTIDDHTLTVKRGIKKSHDVGRVMAYDNAREMSVWPTKECNQYVGTDSTIFPPFMTREEGVAAYAPDLCRSLVATFDRPMDYRGIAVNRYIATFGDMSTDPSLKCYCPTNDTCWKHGLHDLTKCVGAPIVASMPHFYDADPMYVNGVRGLHPNEEEHGIVLVFELMTGTPVSGKKRLQFNLPLQPIEKVKVMKGVPNTLLPLLWVEEGADLPENFAAQLVGIFKMLKIIKIVKIVILVLSLVGLGIGGFLQYKNKDQVTITKAVKPVVDKTSNIQKNIVSVVGQSDDERQNGKREFDRY